MPDTWRVKNWMPRGARVMIAAQFKTGKTIFRDNLVRSLVDGDRFLGRDDVTPITGTVAILDFEMPPAKLKAWLKRQQIRDDDRVVAYSLRSDILSFNLLDGGARQAWAAKLRAQACEVLVIDCLRPVLDALGLDEHREAGRFLVALDAPIAEAAIQETVVIHHMGHTGERARGDSRLRDWPDVEIRLLRRDEQPNSPRFITAFGRDVDVEESALAFNSLTHVLTIDGGSRADLRKEEALNAIVRVLTADGELQSGRAIKDALADSGHARNVIDAALALGVRKRALVQQSGPRNSKLYRVAAL